MTHWQHFKGDIAELHNSGISTHGSWRAAWLGGDEWLVAVETHTAFSSGADIAKRHPGLTQLPAPPNALAERHTAKMAAAQPSSMRDVLALAYTMAGGVIDFVNPDNY